MNGVPVDPGVQDPTRARGSGRGSGRRSGLTYLIGGILLVGVIALLSVVVLILGGLALIGYGIYIGIRARRGSLRNAEPSATPISTQAHVPDATSPLPPVIGQTVFEREPSYGLSAACVVVGFVMFIGGSAVAGSTDDSPSLPAAVPPSLPVAPPSATNREPASTAPALHASATPTSTVARAAAPAERAETPSGRAAVRPQPVAPQPATPQPATSPPATSPPATPQADNDTNDGGAAYYKNCAAARAAGAAPIKRGEPGYRSELDRDGDGTACDK